MLTRLRFLSMTSQVDSFLGAHGTAGGPSCYLHFTSAPTGRAVSATTRLPEADVDRSAVLDGLHTPENAAAAKKVAPRRSFSNVLQLPTPRVHMFGLRLLLPLLIGEATL